MQKYIHFLIDVLLATILKIIGVVLLVDILAQIAIRYLPFSAVWTDELGRLLFVWFAMLSTAMAYAKNQHLSIDFFYNKFPKVIRTFLDYFSVLIVMAVSVLLTYTGIQLFNIVNIQKAPILKISMVWFYAAVPVGFAFILIYTILRMIENITEHKSLADMGAEDEEGTTNG